MERNALLISLKGDVPDIVEAEVANAVQKVVEQYTNDSQPIEIEKVMKTKVVLSLKEIGSLMAAAFTAGLAWCTRNISF